MQLARTLMPLPMSDVLIPSIGEVSCTDETTPSRCCVPGTSSQARASSKCRGRLQVEIRSINTLVLHVSARLYVPVTW